MACVHAKGRRLNASIDISQAARPARAVRGRAALHLGLSGKGAQRQRRADRGRHPASGYDHFRVGDAVPSLEAIIEIFACTAHTAIEVHCPTCPRMTVARAKLVAPDESRLSLASVGLGDWRLDRIEPVSAAAGDLAAQTGGGDVLIYVHGFKQTFETAVLDAAHLSDGIKFRGRTMRVQ